MKPFVGMPVHYIEGRKRDQKNAAIIVNAGDGDRVTLIVFPCDAKPLLGVNDVGFAVQLKTDVPCGDTTPEVAPVNYWWSAQSIEDAMLAALVDTKSTDATAGKGKGGKS